MRWYHVAMGMLAMAASMVAVSAFAEGPHKTLRAGMIGLDTSHAPAFAKVLTDPKAEGDLADVRLVAAFPGGSPDLPSSRDRVAGYTADLKKLGVEIVGSIDELLKRVDVVFVESVDGRPHLEQVRPVLAAHKPVFVDKPCAGTLADVIEIFRLAQQNNVPCFSASSLRFSPDFQSLRNDPKVGAVRGVDSSGPCSLEPHHPDLFWYGVHGVEMLFTVMGTGCKSVTRVHTEGTDFVVGVWEDGRIGTFRGKRDGKYSYNLLVHGARGTGYADKYGGYVPLIVEICKFFKTGKPPVSAAETIEIFAFMEAADESKREGGCPVTLQSVIAKAQQPAK
jgi:predicted dehydrogenase